jgi:hypothetical protein
MDQEVMDLIRDMDGELIIPIVAIVFGCTTGMVAIIAGAMTKIFVARGRERTRRELAAYIAEGTLDPEKAIAILETGREHRRVT